MSIFSYNPEWWVLLFNPIYSWGGGLKQELGREKVCYTMQSTELLNSIATHSILGDSVAINRSQKKRWMTSLSHLLFFMADSRLAAERGLTRAHSFSFILSESSRLGIGSRKKTHHHLPYESRSGSMCTITDTHSHTHTHTQITYIQTQHALTHSHICINNIHAEIELLSLHIDDSTGMEGSNRHSLPIKCQTQLYSWRKLTAAATALIGKSLPLPQFSTCYINTKM